MRWRWAFALVLGSILLALGTTVAVTLCVPVSFSVPATGQLLPVCEIRVTSPQGGLALEVHAAGAVNEGDLLLRLKAEGEQRRLQQIAAELEQLRARLAYETDRLAGDARRLAAERALVTHDRTQAEASLAAASGPRPEVEDQVRAKLMAQQEQRRDLANQEYEILRKLAQEQTVSAQDVARGQAQATIAGLVLEQMQLEDRKSRLTRADDSRALAAAAERESLRLGELDARADDRRTVFELQQSILKLESERTEVTVDAEQKQLRAPWTGIWDRLRVQTGEYVAAGQEVGMLCRTPDLKFVGVVRETQAAWLAVGQKAKLEMAAFPYLKYGKLPAELTHIEPVVATGAAAGQTNGYRVELLLLPDNAPYQPRAGLHGTADVIIFRGTLMQYLLAEPRAVQAPRRPRPARPERLLDLWK